MRERYNGGERFELPDGMTFEDTLGALLDNARTVRWGTLLKDLVDSEFLGRNIINMQWYLRRIEHTNFTFLRVCL